MSLQIGNSSFNVSPLFKEKLLSSVKNDNFVDKNELEVLKNSAVSDDEKSAVALLEKQNDSSSGLNISLTDDDGIDPTSFTFDIKAEKTTSLEQKVVSLEDKLLKLASKISSPILEKITDLNSDYSKIDDPKIKELISNKIENILKDDNLSPSKKESLISSIEVETKKFVKSQEYYKTQLNEVLPEIKDRVTGLIDKKIEETKVQISKLEEVIQTQGKTPELEVQLKALNEKLKTFSEGISEKSSVFSRRIDAVKTALNDTNKARFEDVLTSLTQKFGPPYTGRAKEVSDFLDSKPEIKKVFSSPEEVNIAIRKRPSDLTDIERTALKEIRNSFFNVPEDGKVFAKVVLPENGTIKGFDTNVKGFVIDAERLKGVKTEEELVNLLRLDFGEKANILGTFKLSDVKISLAKVYPNEVNVAYSREFGGVRDIDIYTYPYSGNGFLTPKGEFPLPESDIDKKISLGLSERTELSFEQFRDTPLEDIKLPKRLKDVGLKDGEIKELNRAIEQLPTKDLQNKANLQIAELLKDESLPPEKIKSSIQQLKDSFKTIDFKKDVPEDIKSLVEKYTKDGKFPNLDKEIGDSQRKLVTQKELLSNADPSDIQKIKSEISKLETKIDELTKIETHFNKSITPKIDEIEINITKNVKIEYSTEKLNSSIDKIPEGDLKSFLKEETEKILKDSSLTPAQKVNRLENIGKEVEAFSARKVKYTQELDALKVKYDPSILSEKIKNVEGQVSKLEELLRANPDDVSLKTQLSALKKDLDDSKGIKRRLDSLGKTISETDELRLRDVVAATKKSFGPPYVDTVAKKVNDLLDSNPDLKKVFNSPEDVNVAIRKFPSELKPEELNALKQIRESFHVIPEQGIPVVKVSFPGDKAPLQKFVIEAEHLKTVKSPEELVDLLKLDYHNSPFVKNGKPTFKLEDIQVTVGRVFPDEVKVPFSTEFVGKSGRDTVIYQYPFSGNGFTTPDNGFPKPELDLGTKAIPEGEVKVIKWNDFQNGNVEDLAPARKAPEPKPSEVKTTEVKTEGVKPNPEPAKASEIKAEIREDVKLNPEEIKPKVESVKPLTELEEKINKLPIEEDSKKLLRTLLEKEEFKSNPKAFDNLLEAFDKAVSDNSTLKVLTELLKDTDSKSIAKAFENPEVGNKILELTKKLLPVFEKYGATATEAIGKIVKGLGKALPVLGGVASAYDAANLGSIALKGKDLQGKDFTSYPKGDPRNTPENLEKLKDIRALALLGSTANALDTLLAVVEATGIGNIDLPIQLGLAGVELLIDFAVDYFYEHPDKLPKELSLGIKATALASAVAFAPAGTVAVAQIYGLDGTIDIATELTKLTGETALNGIKSLNDLSTKALDSDLKSFANNINSLAEIVKNPEKYAQVLGRQVDEVLSEAKALLIDLANKGGKTAKQVFDLLSDVASNPQKYGKAIASGALNLGKSIASSISDSYNASIDFAERLVRNGALKIEEAYEYLSNITSKGLNAGKEFLTDAIKSTKALGTKFTEFAKDFYANPQKYGKLGLEIISNLENSIINGSSQAFDKLKSIANSGVAGAKRAILRSIEGAYNAGKYTLELAKYVVNNPKEASQKLLQITKDSLINIAKSSSKLAGTALNYLEDLQSRVGGALGRFSDTIVDLAKQGGNVAQEIFKSHFAVIKRRLPEILDAVSNLGGAIKDQLIKLVPAKELVSSLIQSGSQGFKHLVNIASQSKDIASAFVSKLSADFAKAWEQSSITNISPFTDLISKYYDQAKALGGKAFNDGRKLLYEAISKLDRNQLGDHIPDWSYSFVKP